MNEVVEDDSNDMVAEVEAEAIEALTFDSVEPIERPSLAQSLSSIELEEIRGIVESQPSMSRMTIPDFHWNGYYDDYYSY